MVQKKEKACYTRWMSTFCLDFGSVVTFFFTNLSCLFLAPYLISSFPHSVRIEAWGSVIHKANCWMEFIIGTVYLELFPQSLKLTQFKMMSKFESLNFYL